VTEWTEPQVWTLIGVFTAAMFSMMGLITGMFTRVLRAEIGGLRETMDARFQGIDARFAAMDAKIDSVHRRLDGIDRDVQVLIRRVFDHPTD